MVQQELTLCKGQTFSLLSQVKELDHEVGWLTVDNNKYR
jgi:hypothetical protein